MTGSSLGIAFGCLLGMVPLLFISGKGDREESPAEVFEAAASNATELLHAHR
jgi:hypothetical protein